MNGKMRTVVLATVCGLLAPLDSHAADVTIAVISLVGDRINLESRNTIDMKRTREERPIPGGMFDKVVLIAAGEVLQKREPKFDVLLMPVTDESLYRIQDTVTDPQEQIRAILGPIQATLKERGVAEVLLITKVWAPAYISVQRRWKAADQGGLFLHGIGFFTDNQIPMKEVRGGEDVHHADGVLVPYTYIKMTLVDPQTLQVIKERTAIQAEAAAIPSGSDMFNAWDAMDAKAKLNSLTEMLRIDVLQNLPLLLSAENH